jgi:hypothetical protein
MLDLYKFHTNPESLDQRIINHQSLDKIYNLIKDMFNILYAAADFKLEWKHDTVGNTEQYIELTMEIGGEYKHGMIRIFYEDDQAMLRTSLNGKVYTRAYGYLSDNRFNDEGVYTAIHRFISALKRS